MLDLVRHRFQMPEADPGLGTSCLCPGTTTILLPLSMGGQSSPERGGTPGSRGPVPSGGGGHLLLKKRSRQSELHRHSRNVPSMAMQENPSLGWAAHFYRQEAGKGGGKDMDHRLRSEHGMENGRGYYLSVEKRGLSPPYWVIKGVINKLLA